MHSWRSTILLLVISWLFSSTALAAETVGDCPPGCVVVGTVTITAGSLQSDLRARRAIDKLLPELIAKGKGMIVRLEGHAKSRKGKTAYIRDSLYLAQEVERYLRLDQKVDLDLSLTALDDKIPPRNSKYVRIVVFPQEFKEKPGVTQTIEYGTR